MITEEVVTAVCARCTKCPAWVVLHMRTTNPEPNVNQFTCPIDSCKTIVRAHDMETKMWQIPMSWSKRGYFYDRELKEL
jgi:hypothetical protein